MLIYIFEIIIWFKLMRFEEEEDEESYKRFRSRETSEAVLRDYAEEYNLSTDYGDLILEQRLQMVNWIMEVRILEPRPPLS